MKSGSLRAMPAPPSRITACGTASCDTIRRPTSRGGRVGHAAKLAGRGQGAEHAVEHLAERRRVDVADRRDLQVARG